MAKVKDKQVQNDGSAYEMPAMNLSEAQQPPAEVKKSRIYYIDRLRTWLTFLVVIHHCFWVVMDETGGWYPFTGPWNFDIPTRVFSYMILTGNQAYFMGLFFFLSGLVTGPSLKRKGPAQFLKDRFIRLMIPTILYELLLFPLLFCFVEAAWAGPQGGITYSAGEVWSFYFSNYSLTRNQMWFTFYLFCFNVLAVILLTFIKPWRDFAFTSRSIEPISQKRMMALLLIVAFSVSAVKALFTCLTGILIDTPGFIVQYVIAFALGIVANSLQFLDHLKKEHIPVTFICSIIMYFLFETFRIYVVGAVFGGLGSIGATVLITLFEQLYAVFFSYFSLVYFKVHQDIKPSEFFSKLIGAAYGTYIIHQWIIVPLAVALAYTKLPPIGAIMVLIFIATPLSWVAGMLLKAIPGADMIL